MAGAEDHGSVSIGWPDATLLSPAVLIPSNKTMEKRFLFAMVLSVLVLMAYSSFMPKPKPIVKKEVINGTGSLPAKQENIEIEVFPDAPTITDEISRNSINEKELIDIQGPESLFRFSSKGGFLAEIVERTNGNTLAFKRIGLIPQWADEDFEVSQNENRIEFKGEFPSGGRVVKVFNILPNNELELKLFYDFPVSTQKISYDLCIAQLDNGKGRNSIDPRYFEYAISRGGMVVRKPANATRKEGEGLGALDWAGIRDRYDSVVVFSQSHVKEVVMEKNGNGSTLSLSVDADAGVAQSGSGDTFRFYVGPQRADNLRRFKEGSEAIVHYGTFDPISRAILYFLKLYQGLTGNWGWAIILVTLTIYLLLFPLSMKSMISMRKMQALQPKIEELRVKHKDNPQKLNAETMELYKREKVNPFGGCLPMILQIPVFVALYQLLMRYTSLKGAGFGWIKDLSEPDRLIVFKSGIPLLGNELNILPILMAGVMFLQQKMTSSSSSGAASNPMAEQQKMMAIMMPILFGFLFYKMPSGLVLYWLFNSILMLVFQWKISKKAIA